MVRLNLCLDDVENCEETTAFVKKGPQFSTYTTEVYPEYFLFVE